MYKKIALALTVVIGQFVNFIPSASALEIGDIPEYKNNLLTDFMIEKIDPEKSEIYLRWFGNKTTTDGEEYYINIWTGKPSDYELSRLGKGSLKEGNLVMKQRIDSDDTRYYRDWTIPVEANTLFVLGMDVPLFENYSGKMVYSVYLGDELVIGRIDYSRCLNASTFSMGMQCVAEIRDDGYIQYHPYFNGLRWYVPDEELAELDDVTYRWQAPKITDEEMVELENSVENSEAITEENNSDNREDNNTSIDTESNIDTEFNTDDDVIDTTDKDIINNIDTVIDTDINMTINTEADVSEDDRKVFPDNNMGSQLDNNVVAQSGGGIDGGRGNDNFNIVWTITGAKNSGSADIIESPLKQEDYVNNTVEKNDTDDEIEVPTLGDSGNSDNYRVNRCGDYGKLATLGLILMATAGVGLLLWWLLFKRNNKSKQEENREDNK